MTPAGKAARVGETDCLETLIEYGANVNSIDANGNTPLHHAVNFNRKDCVRLLLLQTDIDLNKKNNEGKTAMDVAKKEDLILLIKTIQDAENIRRKDVKG